VAPHLIKLNWAQVALLHQGAGSTIDHFLRLPLEESGRQLVEIDTRQPPDPAMASWLGAMAQVVVVRYLPRNWLGVLAQLRRQGTEPIGAGGKNASPAGTGGYRCCLTPSG
jgi:hypothetical protein